MKDAAVKNMNALKKARDDIAKNCYPAFDDLMIYTLERRHLDIPAFTDILVAEGKDFETTSLQDHLKQNVRLLKIAEISFDSNEDIHLPGVESAITSMRGRGYSLIFIVQGDSTGTSVFLGLAKFTESAPDINAALHSYEAAWRANFPGSELQKLSTDEISEVSYIMADCKEFGVLTGIPSLKREEDSNLFVQGLERLIRAMRGKVYSWVSIADPLPQETIQNAIDACQSLQADIHHLVRTDLSKATSKGKTVMLGMFGMLGQGKTDGNAHTDSHSETTTESNTHTQSNLEDYQRAGAVAAPILGIAGGIIGTFICPGIGTAIGAAAGAAAGGLVNGIGAAVTGKSGFSNSITNSKSVTNGYADTVSRAVSQQLGGGGFGTFGMTWTKTTTVGQELLNRKAEYIEEVLQAYEKRLQEGTALGMWNLGHYFCASDESTYNQGIGLVTSLFMGMNSTYEPPRAIKVPKSFCSILRRFNNVYLRFSSIPVSKEDIKANKAQFKDHPLGIMFNGPGTPVNTKELAIATPVATEDVEGISVTERASFGINIPNKRSFEDTLSIGNILDKGNETPNRYKLALSNLPKHLAVFGLTGSGKTNTIHNLLMQLWKNYKIPFLVIEPAKAEYRALAEMEELKDDLLVISAGIDQTSVCPLRLNPFDFDPGYDNDANRVHVLTHIDRLKATFNASFPMYASMPYILEEAILEVYRERGWDLGRSLNRHIDIYHNDFRDYIPNLQDLYLKIDSVVQRKGYFQEQQMNIQAALKARLSSLMVGSKGSMFNCADSIPSKDLFNRPVIIELENMGDDDEKSFLMGLLVSRLYEYRKATFTVNKEKPSSPKHVVVIEEAHRLLTNIPESAANMESANVKGKAVSAFVDMLSEIRAMNQSVFIVDQLPSRVSSNIVKGTGSKIVHRLLAKDDRESVGWTMGLNEEQISDLCLLCTGECIVSQDGDRKAYMCRVRKNDLHETRSGGEISDFTEKYKKENQNIFKLRSGNVDMEDMRFRDNLYKAMLAVGIGQAPEPLFSSITPSRKLKKAWDNQDAWYDIYWQQICAEIWHFYGGNYEKHLLLKKTGLALLKNPCTGIEEYRVVFKTFFEETKTYLLTSSENLIGTAYEQLFLRNRIMANINRTYDLVKDCPDAATRLGQAIKKSLPLLIPTSKTLDFKIIEQIVTEIIFRISPELSFSDVWRNGRNSNGN